MWWWWCGVVVGQILECLKRYLEQCYRLGTGPSGYFLQNPACPSLNLSGRLLPGLKTMLSVCAALETAKWLTHIGRVAMMYI